MRQVDVLSSAMSSDWRLHLPLPRVLRVGLTDRVHRRLYPVLQEQLGWAVRRDLEQ